MQVHRSWFDRDCGVICTFVCTVPHARQSYYNTAFHFPFPASRTDHSQAFVSCSQRIHCRRSSSTQPASSQDVDAEVDTNDTPPRASSPGFADLDVVFGRHLPLADPIRVAVLLTGTLRNFLTQKRQVAAISHTSSTHLPTLICRIKAFNTQVIDALGGAAVVDVFAVIGRSKNGGNSASSSGSPASDCASLRASVSAVRVCLELDPPVSDFDDVLPSAPFALLFRISLVVLH